MNKFLSITIEVLVVVGALLLMHWLHWDSAESSFFKLDSSDYSYFVVVLVGAFIAALSKKNAKVSHLLQKYKCSIQNKAFLLISCVALIMVFVLALMSEGVQSLPLKTRLTFTVAAVFFGLILIYVLWTIFGPKKSPQYDTDSQYLYILLPFSRTPVEWKHITHFSIEEVKQASNQIFIAVHIDNAEELMANESGLMKRKGYELTIPQYGTPYFIPTERCVLTPEQLLEQLNQELRRHKHSA